MQATWNDQVLAESDDTGVVEGDHCFPPHTVNQEFFEARDHHSICPWKGTAHYYDVVVNGE